MIGLKTRAESSPAREAGAKDTNPTTTRSKRTRRVVLSVATAAVMAAAGVLVTGAGGAAADDTYGPYNVLTDYLSPDGTLLVLAVPYGNTQAGAPIIDWTPTGGPEQQWYLSALPDGNWAFVAGNTLLSADGTMCIFTDGVAGHTLTQQPCNASAGEEWAFTDDGQTSADGTVFIQNPGTGLVMDIYGQNHNRGAFIDGWYVNADGNQMFKLNNP